MWEASNRSGLRKRDGIGVIKRPALGFVRLDNRNAGFDERPDAGLIIKFAFARRDKFRLGDNAVAFGFLQQKRADNNGPGSGLKRRCEAIAMDDAELPPQSCARAGQRH